MARSTLFALLVLALIQVVAAIPLGQGLIINKAANGALQARFPRTALHVDRDDPQDPSNAWSIKSFEEGASISTLDNENFVYASNGVAFLMPIEQKWYFENAGNNFYKIKVPNQDLVLTWQEYYGVGEALVQKANGGPEQLWQIQTSSDYGRMYRQ
ncbi:hypothetical protein BGZ68_007362 [Mortierella alpina]|nr:hypothetical protein BGZ68_007362 [Mortierella alpina]